MKIVSLNIRGRRCLKKELCKGFDQQRTGGYGVFTGDKVFGF